MAWSWACSRLAAWRLRLPRSLTARWLLALRRQFSAAPPVSALPTRAASRNGTRRVGYVQSRLRSATAAQDVARVGAVTEREYGHHEDAPSRRSSIPGRPSACVTRRAERLYADMSMYSESSILGSVDHARRRPGASHSGGQPHQFADVRRRYRRVHADHLLPDHLPDPESERSHSAGGMARTVKLRCLDSVCGKTQHRSYLFRVLASVDHLQTAAPDRSPAIPL